MNGNGGEWAEGSQLDLFNTAASKLGYSNAALAWGLSLVRWQSKDDLNSFLDALVYAPSADQGAA